MGEQRSCETSAHAETALVRLLHALGRLQHNYQK
jgi:hypothetical protein